MTERIVAAWQEHAMVTFAGSADTRKYSGGDYGTVTLGEVFGMQPGVAEKMQAQAFIPSTYAAWDARTHEVQRERGQYVALTIDVDSGNLSQEQVAQALRDFVGEGVALLVYSSSSSTAQERKWRGVVPLARAVPFSTWELLQRAAYRHFQDATGVRPDYALARAGQPVYLPNVPTARRGEDGEPLFYQSIVLDGVGLSGASGCVKEVLQVLRNEDALAEAEHARMQDVARRSVASRTAGRGDGDTAMDIVKRFNDCNPIADLLAANAYDRKGRGRDWRSPYQTSGSYATRDFGTHWVSLSESDASAGIGRTVAGSGSTCFGDAFDLYCHFDHGGDFKAAIRALAAEERADRRDDMTRFEPVSAVDDFADFISAGGDAVEQEDGSALDDFADFISDGGDAAEPAPQPAPPTKPQPMELDTGALKRAMSLMDAAQDLEALTVAVPAKIEKMHGLDKMAMNMLAGHYKAAMKRLGVAISIQDARDRLKNKPLEDSLRAQSEVAQAAFKESSSASELLRDWVYLEQSERFANLRDDRELTSKSFNMVYAKDVPLGPDEEQPKSPDRFFALSEGRTVYARMYVPCAWRPEPGGQFFVHEMKHYLNGYSGLTVPAVAQDWKDRDAWRTVRNHIRRLLSGEHEAELLIKWMAHNVQHPGLKILWAPIIYGPPGCGKSTIERLMSGVMGQRNVKGINMDEIYSTFTGWAEGACLRFIEEIRIVGHSRHDVMNKLKPFITNERITIVKKGMDGLDVLNTQNYCAFTNFADAIVLDKEDRRYGVFSTRAKTRAETVELFDQAYWNELYEAINDHPGDIRAWLMDVDLSDFDRISAPPMTQGKMDMIEATRSDEVVNLEAVIEAGAHGVTNDIVSTSHLNAALRAAGLPTMPARRLGKALEELGFVPFANPIKFDGKTCRISVRGKWLEKIQRPDYHAAMFAGEARAALQVSEF